MTEILLPVYVCEILVVDGKPRRFMRRRLIKIERELPGVELVIAVLTTVRGGLPGDKVKRVIAASDLTDNH